MKKIFIHPTTTIITLTLVLLTIFSCCKEDMPKPDPKPDPIPYYDMFRCKINGELFTPYCEGNILSGCNPIDCQYYKDTKSISLRVYNSKTHLKVQINDKPIEIGHNKLRLRKGAFFNGNLQGNCQSYKFDTTLINELFIIKIDTVLQMIEGSFYFDAIHGFLGCENDTVHITEGYFNVPYRH